MIKVMFNTKQFPNIRIGISEYYDTLDGPVEFIMSDENYIEYDTDQELMDFYANLDFRFMDDLDELFNEKMGDDGNYPIEDRVEHFFLVRQVQEGTDKTEREDLIYNGNRSADQGKKRI